MGLLWALGGAVLGGGVVSLILLRRERQENLRIHNAKVRERWAKIADEQGTRQ